MSENQRDYYLREQMKAIQAELGESENGDSETADYRKKIAEAQLPEPVREKLEKELNRLSKQPFGSSEATVIATIWMYAWSCPGAKRPGNGSAWRLPARCWTRTTMGWRR